MATGLEQTAVNPHNLQSGQVRRSVGGLAATALDPLRRAYQAYQQYVGQPFQQAVRGGVRGYFGLPMMSDADALGREAYRQAEALGFTPGVGMPAGAVRLAAEGVQALPSIAGDIGRVIAGMPSGAGAAQAEDFARYQRSIPPSDVSPLTAFHGTPHRFEPTAANPLGEFRASQIGSGEGAQAYGYGLYFAEAPGVAKGYQTTLSPKNFASIVEKGRNSFDVIAPNGDVIASNVLRGPAQKAKDAFDAKQTGSLYTVDIPDEMVAKMLDWDKPLSEQPKRVRDAIKKADPGLFKSGPYSDRLASASAIQSRYPGRVIGNLFEQANKSTASTRYGKPADEMYGIDYWALALRRSENNPSKASEIIRQAGIPGIRYLDAGSRGGADGTRNIVVFPGEESKVKILKRD